MALFTPQSFPKSAASLHTNLDILHGLTIPRVLPVMVHRFTSPSGQDRLGNLDQSRRSFLALSLSSCGRTCFATWIPSRIRRSGATAQTRARLRSSSDDQRLLYPLHCWSCPKLTERLVNRLWEVFWEVATLLKWILFSPLKNEATIPPGEVSARKLILSE